MGLRLEYCSPVITKSLGNTCAWFEDYDRCFVFKGKKGTQRKQISVQNLSLVPPPLLSTIVSSLNPALFWDTNNNNAPIEKPN